MTREEFIAWVLMAGAEHSDTGVSTWLEWDAPVGRIMLRFEHGSPVVIQVFIGGESPPRDFSSMTAATRYLLEVVHDP